MKDSFDKILKLVEKLTPKDINIESPLVSLSLRHYKLELNKSTPFVWDIYPKDNNETIKIIVTIDKQALSDDTEIEELMLKTLKSNDTFEEMVRAFNSFETNNKRVNNLYDLESWTRKETTNYIKYIKTIRFGESKNG